MKQELGSPQLQFLHNATHKYIACCSMKMSARPTAYLGRLILKAISSTSTVQNYHISLLCLWKADVKIFGYAPIPGQQDPCTVNFP